MPPRLIEKAPQQATEALPEKDAHYRIYGGADFTIGDPKFPKKNEVGVEKAKPKTQVPKASVKAQGKEKKPLKYSHCSNAGHSNENCYMLHLEKRPSSTRVKEMEDMIKALAKKFDTKIYGLLYDRQSNKTTGKQESQSYGE